PRLTASGQEGVQLRTVSVSMAAIVLTAVLAAGCRDHECARYSMPENKIQPLFSPDSSLVLTVPQVEDSLGHLFWRITIADTTGAVVYVDTESEFVGNLNVYWKWDPDGRVWLYNSDDGIIHFYSDEPGRWQHAVYGPVGNPLEQGLPEPPDGLLPGYIHETGQ
ncbi:MAG TPA: hypothetical protein P5266_05940, partial [Candidatus Fermentibacter sp.]|nr:hypothetical protein [Candidatus Fermentibacter sp.]